MNNEPLVSVLIPLYNAEPYLDDCIQSVLNQRYQNIEIIIVNDGSTDKSLEIARKYEKIYQCIKVYTQNNKGASFARNKAYSQSKGKYIQYFDADDIMDTGKIFFQMEELKKYGYSVTVSCIGKWYRFSKEISSFKVQELSTYKTYDNSLLYLTECWKTFQCMIGTAWLIPREVHEKVGKWDEALSVHDDYLFFAKCAFYSDKIVFAEKSIVYWRQDNQRSLSKVVTWEGLRSHLLVCDMLVELVKNDMTKYDVKESLAMEYSKFIYRAYPYYMDLVEKAQKSLEAIGYQEPLPMPTKKFKFVTKLFGFYPTARLFGLKDKMIRRIRAFER